MASIHCGNGAKGAANVPASPLRRLPAGMIHMAKVHCAANHVPRMAGKARCRLIGAVWRGVGEASLNIPVCDPPEMRDHTFGTVNKQIMQRLMKTQAKSR